MAFAGVAAHDVVHRPFAAVLSEAHSSEIGLAHRAELLLHDSAMN